MLRLAGCSHMQGFLFGKAEPAGYFDSQPASGCRQPMISRAQAALLRRWGRPTSSFAVGNRLITNVAAIGLFAAMAIFASLTPDGLDQFRAAGDAERCRPTAPGLSRRFAPGRSPPTRATGRGR